MSDATVMEWVFVCDAQLVNKITQKMHIGWCSYLVCRFPWSALLESKVIEGQQSKVWKPRKHGNCRSKVWLNFIKGKKIFHCELKNPLSIWGEQ